MIKKMVTILRMRRVKKAFCVTLLGVKSGVELVIKKHKFTEKYIILEPVVRVITTPI
jgi:hypothetical protein